MLTYKKGCGFLNKVINNLPVELHIPGYQFCGPGTKLKRRLARGDSGINPLDVACKQHDISYLQNPNNLTERHSADKILAEKASNRIFAKDASFGEKVAALSVSNIINMKRKMGMSLSKNKKNKRKSEKGLKKKIAFRKIISIAKKHMKHKKDKINSALIAAKAVIKKEGGKNNIRIPRIIPIPTKIGGVLPLIPIFAGLSALGSIVSGASGIVKAVNAVNIAKQQLNENIRHNKSLENIKVGKGAYVKLYRKGLGLYLSKN